MGKSGPGATQVNAGSKNRTRRNADCADGRGFEKKGKERISQKTRNADRMKGGSQFKRSIGESLFMTQPQTMNLSPNPRPSAQSAFLRVLFLDPAFPFSALGFRKHDGRPARGARRPRVLVEVPRDGTGR